MLPETGFGGPSGRGLVAGWAVLRYNRFAMRDREAIVGLLRAVAARMRIARVLHEFGFALCVVLSALAVFALVREPLAAVFGNAFWLVLAVVLTVFSVYVIGRGLRRVPMAQAASLVDSRLPLHDELKSAYWFVSQQDQFDAREDAFVHAHVANAARTAEGVPGPRVLPLRVPRSIALAVLPAVALTGAIWGNPHLVRARVAPDSNAVELSSDAQSARELLAAKASDDEEVKQLDRALATFEKSDASLRQRQEAALQARDAVDKLNMQASVTREGLARLAQAMKGKPGLEEVAQAIEEGRTEDAIAMLEKMRNELEQESAGEDKGRQQGSAQARHSESEPKSAQDIGETARDLANTNGRMNEDSIAHMIENLEQAQDTMQTQQRANAARRKMDSTDELMVGMTAQQSQLQPGQDSMQNETPMGTPSPDFGKNDLRGANMFRQASLAPGEKDQDDSGSTTGAPGGHSAARALEGRATKRLDAVLKLERVKVDGSDKPNEDEQKNSGWFYTASQKEQAETEFAEVRGRADYADADVMRPGYVPIQQKQAVRDYFINIHESSKK